MQRMWRGASRGHHTISIRRFCLKSGRLAADERVRCWWHFCLQYVRDDANANLIYHRRALLRYGTVQFVSNGKKRDLPNYEQGRSKTKHHRKIPPQKGSISNQIKEATLWSSSGFVSISTYRRQGERERVSGKNMWMFYKGENNSGVCCRYRWFGSWMKILCRIMCFFSLRIRGSLWVYVNNIFVSQDTKKNTQSNAPSSSFIYSVASLVVVKYQQIFDLCLGREHRCLNLDIDYFCFESKRNPLTHKHPTKNSQNHQVKEFQR